MEAELQDIQQFISQYPPFNLLSEEKLAQVVHHIEISYVRENTAIIKFDENINDLYMVRSGIVEIYRRKGELYHRLDEGDIFGQMGLLMNGRVRFPATAMTDCLLYCIPKTIFHELYDTEETFADFVEIEDSARLRQVNSETKNANDLTTSKVKTLLNREAVMLDKDATIQTAAKLMTDENISALLIIDESIQLNDDTPSQVVGIITDRDLCTKVLAQGLSPDKPIGEVMSTEMIALDHNAYIYEAMLTMLRCNIHHLPILKNKKPIGIIEVGDIIHYESQNSLLLVNQIFNQQSISELEAIAETVNDCFVRLVHEDANSHMVGTAMSVIGQSFKQRILELAEEKFGEPPVPYCFLALGSMARDEQLAATDQDNALILDDTYDEKLHGEYFAQLSEFVCQSLARCGYKLCTGNIMASNPEWRKTRSEWENCFANWIDNPTPHALLNCSIFFDLIGVYGRTKWAETLNSFIVRRAKKNQKFLACLARNAISRTPPLGFFKGFVMEKDGRHNNSINLKRRGTAPLADLIRVHGLAVGSQAQNSFERLDDIIEAGILPKGRAEDLKDAMEYISLVRIRHQALDIENKIEPDNNIEPENMSDFERRNLKDAFQILSNAQNFLKYRYHGNSFKNAPQPTMKASSFRRK